MRFSQRMGFNPPKSIIQIDSMDDELRNSLWNALAMFYWKEIDHGKTFSYSRERQGYHIQIPDEFTVLIYDLWLHYFKFPLDHLPQRWKPQYPSRPSVHGKIEEYFFNCKWYEVYDFVEFIPNNFRSSVYRNNNLNFVKYCNSLMERELSAYRFVNGKIAQITSEEEIASIEEAAATKEQFNAVSIHLEQALDFLADRKSPDYRNSIKESISTVESICKLISEDNKATLGVALKKMEPKVTIHPALKKAFDSLYGYTNDADGIRHALLDESDLKFEDAKFMLVTCSTFINYLKAKLV